jgi:IclR family KDG regulon transcriptional repressor
VGKSLRDINVKSIRSIERVFMVLNCFSLEQKTLNFQALVNQTKLPRSTLYRILHTLEKEDYVVYDENSDEYRLSMKFFKLGVVASSTTYFYQEISPFLDRLKTETPHTILVTGLSDKQMFYLDKRESNRELKVGSEIGQVRPPDYGILGRTLLTFTNEDQRQEIMEDLKKIRSKKEMDHLQSKLEEIKALGYAFAKDETFIGISGVAAPVFDQHHQVIVSLGILAPTAGLEQDEINDMIQLIVKTVQEISYSLGDRKGDSHAKRT